MIWKVIQNQSTEDVGALMLCVANYTIISGICKITQ